MQDLWYNKRKLCQINANFKAKKVRLVLNALNLFKIYAKLTAKYVRYTLFSTLKMQDWR